MSHVLERDKGGSGRVEPACPSLPSDGLVRLLEYVLPPLNLVDPLAPERPPVPTLTDHGPLPALDLKTFLAAARLSLSDRREPASGGGEARRGRGQGGLVGRDRRRVADKADPSVLEGEECLGSLGEERRE